MQQQAAYFSGVEVAASKECLELYSLCCLQAELRFFSFNLNFGGEARCEMMSSAICGWIASGRLLKVDTIILSRLNASAYSGKHTRALDYDE